VLSNREIPIEAVDDVLGTLENSLIPLFEQVFRTIGYLGVVILMAIESACIPLPSEIILPMAGWMVSRQVFTLWGATIAGTLGCVIGSIVAYWVGVFGGRPLLERYGRYVLISVQDLDAADRWFARRGEAAIFLSRMLPVIRTFISLPAGIAEMNFGRFVLFTALGSLPWSFALVYAGKSLGDNWDQVRTVLSKFDYLVVVALFLAIGWYIYHHISRARGHAMGSGSYEPKVRR
jgi:membrane protein DedA with SNARE-associated domain